MSSESESFLGIKSMPPVPLDKSRGIPFWCRKEKGFFPSSRLHRNLVRLFCLIAFIPSLIGFWLRYYGWARGYFSVGFTMLFFNKNLSIWDWCSTISIDKPIVILWAMTLIPLVLFKLKPWVFRVSIFVASVFLLFSIERNVSLILKTKEGYGYSRCREDVGNPHSCYQLGLCYKGELPNMYRSFIPWISEFEKLSKTERMAKAEECFRLSAQGGDPLGQLEYLKILYQNNSTNKALIDDLTRKCIDSNCPAAWLFAAKKMRKSPCVDGGRAFFNLLAKVTRSSDWMTASNIIYWNGDVFYGRDAWDDPSWEGIHSTFSPSEYKELVELDMESRKKYNRRGHDFFMSF